MESALRKHEYVALFISFAEAVFSEFCVEKLHAGIYRQVKMVAHNLKTTPLIINNMLVSFDKGATV